MLSTTYHIFYVRVHSPMKNKCFISWLLWTSFILFPTFLSVLLYHYVSFDFEAASLPMHELRGPSAVAREVNGKILRVAEFVGVGKLLGPEDIAYDSESGLIYTGCEDGWVKRVTVSDSVVDSVVEDWVYTGGRPLGVALGRNGVIVVTDTEKGLLSISKDGTMNLLTDEAEGVKFKLTDGVDVAQDGMIYFTEATNKYSSKEFTLSILEGRPQGKFMSFNPATRETKVLIRDLYFADGVAVSPDQEFVVFCETVMIRCKRYYIKGEKKGSVDIFIDHLPGLPDNIRYDGEGHYWIGLAMETNYQWWLALKYPFIRKAMALLEKYNWRPQLEKNSGVFTVDTEGRPIAHYYDPGLTMLTGGIKIGSYLYISSMSYPYITRLNLNLYTAQAST